MIQQLPYRSVDGDDRSRLVSSSCLPRASHHHFRSGAVVQRRRNGPGQYRRRLGDHRRNRLTAWSGAGQWRNFKHDAVGNVNSESRHDGSRGYTHDPLNRLVTLVVNGIVIYYRCNVLGHRVFKGIGANQTHYVHGASGELLQEVGPQPISAARSDVRDWSKGADRTDVNSGFPTGTYKCNIYADTQYEKAGYNLPNIGGSALSRALGRYPPGAQSLSSSNYSVPGWPVVSGPALAGDLLADRGHVGIATGSGQSISASPGGVVENDWGFRSGQKPVIRRCNCP